MSALLNQETLNSGRQDDYLRYPGTMTDEPTPGTLVLRRTMDDYGS